MDWDHFTPWASLSGGALIGIGASVLIIFAGRVAGISGIMGGLLLPRRGDWGWRLSFVAGLVLSALGARASGYSMDPLFPSDNNIILVAGIMVGFGSRLGSGCTSGHGVCGLARCSVRSAVATACFIGAGIAVVSIMRVMARGEGWSS